MCELQVKSYSGQRGGCSPVSQAALGDCAKEEREVILVKAVFMQSSTYLTEGSLLVTRG